MRHLVAGMLLALYAVSCAQTIVLDSAEPWETDALLVKFRAHDSSGAPIVGLATTDISVSVDGSKAEVLSLNAFTDDPASRLNLMFVIDSSGSMKGKPLQAAKQLAQDVVARLRSGDRASLIRIGSTPELLLGPTDDPSTVASAIQSFQAQGDSAIVDGLRLARRTLATDSLQHRKILLLSDGKDTASKSGFAASGDTSLAEFPIYWLHSGHGDNQVLADMARSSGGSSLDLERTGARRLCEQLLPSVPTRYEARIALPLSESQAVSVAVSYWVNGSEIKREGMFSLPERARAAAVESVNSYAPWLWGALGLNVALVAGLLTRLRATRRLK